MKQILYFGLFATTFIACSTPGSAPKTEAVNTQMEDTILQKAIRRGDVATALSNIHIIMEKDSTRTGLNDTLFQFYLQMENPQGVADVGQILLQSKPNDLDILEPTAMGLSAIREYEKALVLHQRMFAITGDPRLKITIATLLFEMKKIDEARAEIQWIVDHREISDTMKVEQPSPAFGTQKISMLAVAYYSFGQIEFTLGNKKEALKFWHKALSIEPRYDMAATAINEINK
ncbi:MAG: tetratricopeptide repeat protein [Bacteroidia bacterium]